VEHKPIKEYGWVCRNSANALTWLGVALTTVVLWLVQPENREGTIEVLLCVATLAAITDVLDGFLARYFEKRGYVGSVSSFGAFLDRFRDKYLQFTMYYFMASDHRVDAWLNWIAWFLIATEIGLSVTLVVGAIRRIKVSAGAWGKNKTLVSNICLFFLLLNIILHEHGVDVQFPMSQALFCVFVAVVVLGVMSFVGHSPCFFPRPRPQQS